MEISFGNPCFSKERQISYRDTIYGQRCLLNIQEKQDKLHLSEMTMEIVIKQTT